MVKISKITLFVAFVSLMMLSTTFIGETNAIQTNVGAAETEYIAQAYEVPELPDETIPEWEFNITGIGISEPITLNLTYLIDQVNNSQLNAYEETIDYKGSNQTVIGFDILQLVQDYADVWYAGEFEFIAEDDYAKSLNATEIVYSYHPPALENADIKILLAFAVNGSYLPNSDWANKGALRLVCPSNQQVDYWSSMWVGNVTEVSITDKWKCDVYVDEEIKTSIPVGFADELPDDISYLKYNLTYHDENVEFEGPSILSILDSVNVSYDDIFTINIEAPDSISLIDKSEIIGEKPAILAIAADGEVFGFNNGPFRMVGGNLNSWHWLKNCFAIHIVTGTPTADVPGFGACIVLMSLLAIPIVSNINKKRK